MSLRQTENAPGALSPTLTVVIEALQYHANDRAGEAAALRELGELARRQIPARGVFAPKEVEIVLAIDAIARTHLNLEDAIQTFLVAVGDVEPFGRRDEIQSAANHIVAVSDTTYFYAGLAFGVTLVGPPR